MNQSPNVYRIVQSIHPKSNRYHAWQEVQYQAALRLWEILDSHFHAGSNWVAVRIEQHETPPIPESESPGGWVLEQMIDLTTVPLAGRQPPQHAPMDYSNMPTPELIRPALGELGHRLRQKIRRIFR